ncbi:transposable element Tc1 transposase [Trichonephila clavipes]|nr:transposable element Tc1 transposase [Trichonephila clavipes]
MSSNNCLDNSLRWKAVGRTIEIHQTDSHRVFIWRESIAHFHPSYITEIDRFDGKEIFVWEDIMLGSCTPLHTLDIIVHAQRFIDEALEAYVRLFRGAMGLDYIFMDDNARPHRDRIVDVFLEEENIRLMDCISRSPDLSPNEHV